MSQNINQIFVANPAASMNASDLFYLGRSPYGVTDDFAITWANVLTSIRTQATGTYSIDISGNAATATTATTATSAGTITSIGAMKLYGNSTGGAANGQDITLGTGLSFTGSTLNVTTSGSVAPVNIQNSSFNYAKDITGSVDSFIANYSPAITSIVDGQGIIMAEASANNFSNHPNISVNGLTAKSISYPDGGGLVPFDIADNSPGDYIYSSAKSAYLLSNPRSLYKIAPSYIGTSDSLFAVIDSGTVDHIEIQFTIDFMQAFAPFTGCLLYILATNDNTGGTCTLNLNGTGVVSVQIKGGTNPPANTFKNGWYTPVIFNGSVWQVIG